ncbi:DUF6343 family protein [Streptomyces sp. NPDC018693]|uniref:DUF6343 family protein n=1 Tax=unclassified Streptomyces TaxID=2593676 RepID=UPI003796F50F
MTDRHPDRAGAEAARERAGLIGRYFPRTGTEPLTARSALGLRLLLALLFLPVFTAGAIGFALWSAASGPGDSPSSGVLTGLATLCAILAVLTALDLWVISRRLRRERALRRGQAAGRR